MSTFIDLSLLLKNSTKKVQLTKWIKLLKDIYKFEKSLTGLVAEPVKSAVKANISIEANQFYLHQLFSRK